MDPELMQNISRCIGLMNRLESEMKDSRCNAVKCFEGELLTSYQSSTDEALDIVQSIKRLLAEIEANA